MSITRVSVQKLLLRASFLSFFFVSIVGLYHIASMAEMKMPMQNCPFTLGQHVFCQMGIVDHLNAREIFAKIILQTLKFFYLPGILLLSFSFTKYLRLSIRNKMYLVRHKKKDFSFYAHLYSEGILNPKLF